jgi:phosphoesterase RecJ-like protein
MYQVVWNKIKEYDSIVIYGHVNPDGDCYGSELGLKRAILDAFPNKKVYAVGSGYPRLYSLVGELDKVDDEVIKSSLSIVVDTSNQERIEDQRYKMGLDVIKIDHHIAQEHFGNPELLETERISCTEVIAKMLLENNVTISKEAALPLFLGLVTDSGRFLYQPISKETYQIAGVLADTGIDCNALYDALYEVDEKLLRLKGFIFTNYRKTKENVAYLVLSKEDLRKLNVDYNLGASQVNSIANIKGCPAWVFFSESESGLVRVEFRSKDINVQEIASKFGGGGHHHASGCRLDALEDYKYVLEALDKAVRG